MFEPKEISRTKGRPVNLLLFQYDDGEVRSFAYTDAVEPVEAPSAGPFVFKPVSLDRDAINASGSLDKTSITIKLPQDNELALQFRTYPPGQVVNVTLWQMHLNDPDAEALVVWAGRVTAVTRRANIAEFNCEPISTALRRTGLRRNWQIGCPHVLYGTQCKASQAAGTSPDITVSEVNGNVVKLPSGWIPASPAGLTADKYIGGMLRWVTAEGSIFFRTILRVDADGPDHNLTLAGPTDGLYAAAPAQVVLGCNHQLSDCAAVHDNLLNFGGQPYIPVKNPFGFANQFY